MTNTESARSAMDAPQISSIVQKHRPDLSRYEDLYKRLHSSPELSNQEHETAARIVTQLREISEEFEIVTGVGGTGVVASLRNGSGPKVLLRADIDALPVEEATGLAYASSVRVRDADGVEKPVMHACGHDIHMTSLLGAADLLFAAKATWSGTLILAFQPAEERGTGAQAMVDDGMYDPERHNVPIPDICIGGHVTSNRSGTVGTRRGVMASSADSMRVTLHGRGGHASAPHNLVDPIVMAAHIITRLQTVISRETNPADHGVLTVASIQAGSAENVVVDDVHLAIDARAMTDATRAAILAGTKRIIEAESEASAAPKPPEITPTRSFPLTVNDEAATARIEESYAAHFESAYNASAPALSFSEDFAILGTSVGCPIVFFMYGGTDPALWDRSERDGTLNSDIPTNHSGRFAPVIQPTVRIGLDAYAVGALSWLVKG